MQTEPTEPTEPTVTIPRRLFDDLVNLAECAADVPRALNWGPLAIAETRYTLAEAAQYATHPVYTDQGRVASVDHFGGSASVDHGNSRVLWESKGWRPGR